jgi:hypothetical protein
VAMAVTKDFNTTIRFFMRKYPLWSTSFLPLASAILRLKQCRLVDDRCFGAPALDCSELRRVWIADEKLRKQVKAALHADPYFYDRHLTVSIEDGVVVLRGFVFSDWDLRQALSIARKAAGDKTVVDHLSIKEGGR